MSRVRKTSRDQKPSNLEEQVSAAVGAARAALETDGFVAAAQLGPTKIRAEVATRLLGEGFEKAGKGVRLPLSKQVDALVESRQHIPVNRFASLLRGVSATEATKQRIALVRDGRMALVLRGKQLTLVPNSERVVNRRSLKPLVDALKTAQAWLAKANADKAGATVLQADVVEALSEVTRLVAAPDAEKRRALESGTSRVSNRVTPTTHGTAIDAAVRGAILTLRDEDTALASVPAVSRKLRTSATATEIIQALLEGFKKGQLELRPEGGISRLSNAEIALCPKGAGGVPLSWVRLLEGEP